LMLGNATGASEFRFRLRPVGEVRWSGKNPPRIKTGN
jgi:hypothetical protein